MAVGRQEAVAAYAYLFLCWASLDARKHVFPEYCDGTKTKTPLSFLWGVRRHPPSYLFGTIHVPYTRVWDYIPENTKQAFHESERVYFELDLTDGKTLAALHRCQMMPRGRKLRDILPEPMLKRLKNHLEYVKRMIPHWMTSDQRDRGLHEDYLFASLTGDWQRKRPVWVMLMVSSLTEGDIKWRGVPVLDLYLAQKALQLRKAVGAVEDASEQCSPLNGLSLSQVVFALNQTLNHLEKLRFGKTNETVSTEDLIKHYNCKDMNAIIFNQDASQIIKLPQFSNGTFQPTEEGAAKVIDNYFHEELITKRNLRMGQKVAALLRDNPDKSFFFAFGAGHFLGNQTMLKVVEESGFQIERILPNLRLKDFRKRCMSSTEVRADARKVPKPVLIEGLSHHVTFSDGERIHGDDAAISHIINEQKKKNAQTTSWIPRNHQNQQRRNFNELWVRLPPYPTRSDFPLSIEEEYSNAQNPYGSQRIWYGVPSAAAVIFSNYLLVVILTTCASLGFKSS
ncbi:metalloprotease TIKI2-like isoform X2 [Ischnura elegans]|uniref:metalloprotease TIKI2-like isoform X2 n=1 Tax=Ischnura elegans TaxID=197161 RepID=UPI001ED880A4|nr:metalloprotease TIKI2-like isoform X2 [Ischnura elegans]